MYKFFRGVKKLIFSFSYFQASQYFRFRKNDSYVHSSAGFLSLALQIIIIISLIYQLVAIFSGNSALVGTSDTYAFPPTASSIGYSANFMMAIEKITSVAGLTVKFYQVDQTRSSKTKTLLGSGQQCTTQHWTNLMIQSQNFTNSNFQNWICMPKNINANLQGTKSSGNTLSYLSMDIECPGCSTNQSSIQLLLHYKNALINPSSGHSYLQYYIDSQNSISLVNSQTNNGLSIGVQSYTIQSDTTVLPWYSFIYQYGLIARRTSGETITTATNSYYTQVLVKKGPKSTTYTRNLLKILDAFYFIIGSFAPTLLAFAFFIYPILSSIFEMRFAKYVYRLEQGKQYGLISYMKEEFYSLFKNICHLNSQKWQRWEKIAEVREILAKVMQIQYLYERIDFLQRSIKFLFRDHQLCGLRLMKKDSILDAEQKYKRYQIRKAIKNYVATNQRKQLQQIKNQTDKQIISAKTIKNASEFQDHSEAPIQRMQSQMINVKKISFDLRQNTKAKKTVFQGTKQFEINALDVESEKMCKRIQDEKEFYVKLVKDFNRLKRQAKSDQSKDMVSKLIYDQLRQNDVELMQQFERCLNIKDKPSLSQRGGTRQRGQPQQARKMYSIDQPARTQTLLVSNEAKGVYEQYLKKKANK